jgi:hypothetical protein
MDPISLAVFGGSAVALMSAARYMMSGTNEEPSVTLAAIGDTEDEYSRPKKNTTSMTTPVSPVTETLLTSLRESELFKKMKDKDV